MLLMLNVTLVGCCSLSDSVYVSQIPQRLTAEKEKKMTTFSIFNEKSLCMPKLFNKALNCHQNWKRRTKPPLFLVNIKVTLKERLISYFLSGLPNGWLPVGGKNKLLTPLF